MQNLILHEGSHTLLTWNRHNNQIVKSLKKEFPTPEEVQRFKNEYEILQGVNISGVRKALTYQEENQYSKIFLEYLVGKNIRDFFRENCLNLEEKLAVFRNIAQILAKVHQQGIIHKDLNPSNIIINEDLEVHFIDFGISSRFTLKQPNLGNPEKLEGTLHYISPEQTGRMNRSIDYRTDLYALGASLYELLTGQVPFQAVEAIDLVHAHLAKTPLNPIRIKPEIPDALADMILKLLAKNPEERYQSASGVAKDLDKCINLLKQGQKNFQFDLGQEDFSGKLQIPEKLYGRETETKTILEAFERVKAGSVELTLVAGHSGTGKSVLVNETHRPLASTKGYFVEGKFDQFQRNIPFSAWIQAFTNFVNLLLTENEDTLQYWKTIILEAIGNNGGVLTEVIPNLELVIGEQTAVAELGGQEAQNRFNYVMQSFVKTITTPEHPLIIFIDDLQWADTASLKLLQTLVTDQDNAHLLCVGAYRDNEVSATHTLVSILEDIEKDTHNINQIKIGNLSEEAVLDLLMDTLNQSESKQLTALVKLILSKTRGNAFFTHEFLKNLYEEELLKFDFEQKQWIWEHSKIQEANFTDNVVAFMAKKVDDLPEKTQSLLELASCIGSQFDDLTLRIIAEKISIKKDLELAILEGLIFPTQNKQYKFAHDRVRQAAYSLIPANTKQTTHFKIGQLLYESLSEEEIQDRLLDIVNHLNYGIELIEDEDFKETLIHLNLDAGIKAKKQLAFETALKYFEQVQALLPQNHWESHYEISKNLYELWTESHLLARNFEAMEATSQIALTHIQELTTRLKIYQTKIVAYVTQTKLDKGLALVDELFPNIDIHFPKNPDETYISQALEAVEAKLQGREIQDLVHLPIATDEEQIAISETLLSVFSLCFVARPSWIPLILAKQINITLEFGMMPLSSFTFACYALYLSSKGDFNTGKAYGELADSLLDKFEDKVYRCKVKYTLAVGVIHWTANVEETFKAFQEAYEIGLETGDFEYAAYAMLHYGGYSYVRGVNLNTVKHRLQTHSDILAQYGQINNLGYHDICLQTISNVLYGLDDANVLTGDYFDEEERINYYKEVNDVYALFQIYRHKSGISYVLGKVQEARKYAEIADSYIDGVTGMAHLASHSFYSTLSILSTIDIAKDTEMLALLEHKMAQFKEWAEYAPENHYHKYLVIKAEYLKLHQKSFAEIQPLYKESIALAEKNAYVQDAALACELYAGYLFSIGENMFAEPYLKKAYRIFKQWGAKAKVLQMETQYVSFLGEKVSSHDTTKSTYSTTFANTSVTMTKKNVALDLDTFLKANTVLAQQTRLKDLINEMLELLIQNSGANKIVFLLKDNQHWLIEGDRENGLHLITESQKFETYDNIPKQVIAYVMRSKEFILLDDISQNRQFSKDLYIQKNNSKSVFVIPVKKHKEVLALLYLENNLNTGVFHQKRYELIKALVTQLAISMENTMLYENLEAKVAVRTQELKQSNDELQVLNEELVQTQEEVQAQRDHAEAKNKELEMTNFKLKSSEQILKKMNTKMKEAKAEVEEKNKVLALTNQQINLSIKSAKAIQEAILPTAHKLARTLKDYFLIYRPKDVVSGDFYWLTQNENKIYLAVADCTGHGVPGAFMANMGITFLYNIIQTKKLSDLTNILELLHREISVSLKQNKTGNNNGMDIALLTLEKEENGATNIEFCGAKRPLYYISAEDKTLTEIQGVRRAIGGFQNKKVAFEVHHLNLPPESLLYVGSDGLSDQNNPKRKKLGSKQLKQTLQDIYTAPLPVQKQILDNLLDIHMTGTLQRDDILFMGIRI